MNIRHNIALRQKLAAEYVLGTLKGGARRRFERWLYQDADLRNIVAQWQGRLAPMAEFAGDVTPPKSVWSGIERRLNLRAHAPSWKFWLNENLAFWRSLGMVSTGLAAMLLVLVLVNRPADTPTISYVATLTDDKAQTTMLLTADSRHHAIDARVVGVQNVPSDKTLHLWAVPKSGNPRSLGILADNTRGRFALTDKAIGDDVLVLAVSLEPKGGSPDPNGPTGPILWKGNWVRL
jgi:anti-sigma-K factor RskA